MARPATAKSVNNKVFTSRLQRAARQFSDSVQCSGPGLSTSAVQAQSYGSTFVRYRHYGKGNDESTTYSIAIGKRKSSTLDSTQEKVAVIFSRGEVGKHYKFEFFCRHFSCVGSETRRAGGCCMLCQLMNNSLHSASQQTTGPQRNTRLAHSALTWAILAHSALTGAILAHSALTSAILAHSALTGAALPANMTDPAIIKSLNCCISCSLDWPPTTHNIPQSESYKSLFKSAVKAETAAIQFKPPRNLSRIYKVINYVWLNMSPDIRRTV